ncbi:MAG: 4Fe-4S binding protein [Deltaproteobacteria bacterium]|nr:4Fe-4S binding protein [Deltaproteobacteria bacterium]
MAVKHAKPAPEVRPRGPRRAVQPADLVLKKAPRYQRVRRIVLALSCSTYLLAPLWQLGAARGLWAGFAGGGRWGALAQALPLPKPELLGAPWTVQLFGIELMDPLAALSVVAARQFPVGVLLGALPVALLLMGFGRFFCGWLCPYVPMLAASNAARALLTRLGVPLADVQLPRGVAYGVLAGVLSAAAIAGAPLVALVYPPAIVSREVARAVWTGSFGAGALALAGIWLFDTLVSRGGFCRTLCPGGALFSLFALPSRVRVTRDIPRCTDCTACDVVCNLGQKPMTDRLDPGCERCGKCVSVCPTQALAFKLVPLRTKEPR